MDDRINFKFLKKSDGSLKDKPTLKYLEKTNIEKCTNLLNV